MAGTITYTNHVNEWLAVMRNITSFEIHIGIQADEDSMILMIASVNEFGANIEVTDKMRKYLGATGLHLKKETTHINIPERSFIRGGFNENKAEMERVIKNLLKKVILMEISVSQFHHQIGQFCVGKMQEYLTDLRDPPNHPYTLEQKSPKTNPLINTGELRQKITYKVVHI